MYSLIYALSKGLVCTTTAFMCKRALLLGGLHLHQLFLLDTKDNTSVYRRAELAIVDLMRNPQKIEFLRSLQVLFFDEAGQVSDEMFAVLDIILRRVKDCNIFISFGYDVSDFFRQRRTSETVLSKRDNINAYAV